MLDRLRAAWHSFTSSDHARDQSERPDWKHWNRQLQQFRHLEASYEAALQRDDLWQLADFRDADATLRASIRRQIRSRSRHERESNPLVDRILKVWVGDVVGECGPWIKVSSGNKQVNRFIEQAWLRWWGTSNQTGKLKTAVFAEASDGEAVAKFFSNRKLKRDQHPQRGIELDLRSFEADRLASPNQEESTRTGYVDGVHLDPVTDLPVAYDLLKAHPGTQDIDELSVMFECDTYPADEILHCFDKLRPEQHRGVCRYVSALPIAGIMRKCLEAEMTRMQIIAAFTFIIKSMVPPEEAEDGGNEDQWWQEISLPNRQGIGMFLPEGYDVGQLEAKGQAGNVDLVNGLVAGCIAGCFAMPLGYALGKFGASGYAPIRGEMLPYHKFISLARTTIWEPQYLRPTYHQFLYELQLTPGWVLLMQSLTPEQIASLDLSNVEFKWTGRELVVDPSREKEALRKDMAMGLKTREDEIDSNDLDEHDRRAARSLGFGEDEEAVRKYRQLCAASIHQVQLPGTEAEKPEDDPQAGPEKAGSEKADDDDKAQSSRTE